MNSFPRFFGMGAFFEAGISTDGSVTADTSSACSPTKERGAAAKLEEEGAPLLAKKDG